MPCGFDDDHAKCDGQPPIDAENAEMTSAGQKLNADSIRMLRILGVVTAIVVPPFRYILPPDAMDPMWIRILLSCIALGIVAASFIWPRLRNYGREISYGLSFMLTGWMLWLAVANRLDQAYTSSYYIMLFASIILYRDRWWMIAFVSFNGLATLVSVFLVSNPTFSPITFVAMVLSILGLGSIGQWMGVLEIQESLFAGTRLRYLNQTALATSNEGIVVTDPLGQIQRSNTVFQNFFDIQIQQDQVMALEAWLQAVQRRIKTPEIVMAWSKAVTLNVDLEIKEQFQLLDGRYLRVFSKPIMQGADNHGRIWFFKDVSNVQRQQAAMEQQQQRLRRQNEMLYSLSTDATMLSGSLEGSAALVAQEAALTLGAERATVWKLSSNGLLMDCLKAYNRETSLFEEGGTISSSNRPAFWDRIASERVIVLSNIEMLGHTPTPLPLALPGARAVHMIFVPLRLHGKVFGAISAERDAQRPDWTLDDQQFLAAVGDLMAANVAAGERRRAERDLAKSAALLQAVFELAGVGILVTRADRTVIDCNNTYLSIFGFTREFVLQSKPEDVINKSQELVLDIEKVSDRMRFLQENPHENRFESLFFKDGRILETFTEVLRVDGQIIGRVWFYRDVTERMAAEARLRESEIRNQAIIDAIPDLMMRISRGSGILDLKIPEGWEKSALILDSKAQTVRQLLPVELAQAIMLQASQVFEEQVLAWHEQAIELNGSLRDIETRIAPSGTNEVLIMLRDVTDRKKTEKELLQRNHELDSFVYRASHDLKAPLNSLMGLIDIIRAESIDPQLMTYLQLMDKSVVKLDTFIRNLTDFSRINRLAVQYQEIEFDKLIAEVNEGLRYMQNSERVTRNIQIEQSAPFRGDNFHLSIVLSNIISNAIKYFDPKKAASHVDIHVQANATQCVIEVSDNGVGIPKIHQARIFELFYRATNQSFGSGLGLYITRNAIEKMGGTIVMESEEGMGTKFRVVLPNQTQLVEQSVAGNPSADAQSA